MQSRILHTRIWKDEYFASLSNSEKLLFIYFLTNERVNILHCYELSTREIVFDTGLSDETIRKAKAKFEQDKKISFMDNFVLLIKAGRYQNYTGELNEIAKNKLFGKLPPNIIKWYNDTVYIPLEIRNKKPIIRNKNEEGDVSNDIPF